MISDLRQAAQRFVRAYDNLDTPSYDSNEWSAALDALRDTLWATPAAPLDDRGRDLLRETMPMIELWTRLATSQRAFLLNSGGDDSVPAEHERHGRGLRNAIDAYLAAPPVEPSGQWLYCSPELITAGVDCGRTPRRPYHTGVGHEHFIAWAEYQAPPVEPATSPRPAAREPSEKAIAAAAEVLHEELMTDRYFTPWAELPEAQREKRRSMAKSVLLEGYAVDFGAGNGEET